jgi:hypothetical protein
MAQIVVRGIDDRLMQVFRTRAKKGGRSVEQEVRRLIEESARDALAWQKFIRETGKLVQELRERGVDYGDSVTDIRRDRER